VSPHGPDCQEPDCARPAYARGWCGMHYKRWLRTGSPIRGDAHAAAASTRCDAQAKSRGWCHAHYQRWRTHGDVGADVPLRSSRAVPGRGLRPTALRPRAVQHPLPPAARDRVRPGGRTDPDRDRRRVVEPRLLEGPGTRGGSLAHARARLGDGAPAGHGSGTRSAAAGRRGRPPPSTATGPTTAREPRAVEHGPPEGPAGGGQGRLRRGDAPSVRPREARDRRCGRSGPQRRSPPWPRPRGLRCSCN
jgi:hypothetical protein